MFNFLHFEATIEFKESLERYRIHSIIQRDKYRRLSGQYK